MTAQIRPNRLSVSDRFPMLGFAIRTGDAAPRRAEVTLATDPALFDKPEGRRAENFFSTSSLGPLTVEGGEAAYVVPTEVMARFVGAEKLYFALATGPVDGGALSVDVRPGEDSPYVSISGLTGRSLRRVRMFPPRVSRAGNGYGDRSTPLSWAGDAAQPGMESGKRGNGAAHGNGATHGNGTVPSNGNGATAANGGGSPPTPAEAIDYDDGFGALPDLPAGDQAGQGGMTGAAQALARAMDAGDAQLGERRPVSPPEVSTLGFWASSGIQLAIAANPALTTTVVAARAAVEAMDVSIGIGPAVSGGGLGSGLGAGFGIIFAPGNVIGGYGTVEINTGTLAQISGTLQITIMKGGVESFSGIAFEAGFIAGAEGIVGGASALFNDRGEFIGVTVQGGLGVVPTVIEFFGSVQTTVAGQLGHAVAHAVKTPTVAALTSDDIEIGERHAIEAPEATSLGWALSLAAQGALAANPAFTPLVVAARAAAEAGNVSIGIGPAVSGGLGAGAELGVGIIFAPGNELGVYGSASALVGAITSISLTVQVTIVRGGISSFEGMSTAAGFSAGEGVVGGGSVLFDAQGDFLGVSFQIGIGAGLSPLEVYASVQRGVAARAQAQALSTTAWPAFYQGGKSRDGRTYAAYKASLSSRQVGPASGYGGTELPVYESEISADDLREIYPGLDADVTAGKVSASRIEGYAQALNRAFDLTGLDTVEAQAAYLAHAAVEAHQLQRLTEGQSWRQNYEDDPTKIRLDTTWLNNAARNNANYRMGGEINPGGDATWQQSFIGRGPLQVTFRYHYAQTLALLERLAERRRSAGFGEDADAIMDCVESVKQDPRQAASPVCGYLFSAAYMKMAEGDRYILDAGATPTFNGTGPESARWMTGGTREEPGKAQAKKLAYQRAVSVLRRKLETAQAASLGLPGRRAYGTAMGGGADAYAVEVKYRMFIPSPVIKGPPMYDDFGGDNRGFQYSGGTSRGEIVATVHLSSGLGIDGVDVTRRHWGTTKAYDDDNTFHVSGKPDWWMDKNPGTPIKEQETLVATTDNLDVVPGTSGQRGVRVYAENASAVTVRAEGTNPLVSVAPAIDVDVSVLFRLGSNGQIQAKALGKHDGFPAHELYVNGNLIHSYDPVAAGNDPWSLVGYGDQDVDGDWVTVANVSTAQAAGLALGARALQFNESFTLNWDEVQLINQPTDMSCWAASGAMVVGWRDRMSLTPETIASIGGRTTATGLDPKQVGQFANDLGLVAEPPMSWSQEGFRQLLEDNGPLWVASAPAGLHAIVVTGLYNDGPQLYVRISDPWDRAVGTPGSPGAYASSHATGSRYIMKWEDFAREYERPAYAGLVFLQILHSGETGGRQPNRGQRTPPGYAQSLEAAKQVPSGAPVPSPSPLKVTLGDEVRPVVPPLTTGVDPEGVDPGVAWQNRVAELDATLIGALEAIPALAAARGWTIGIGRESAGGAVGSGIGVTADGSHFRYGPPANGGNAPPMMNNGSEPLMVTVVEGGLDAFTGWSRARGLTASDGVTGALLLNEAGLPVGAALRLVPTGDLAPRLEAIVAAIHAAHVSAGAPAGAPGGNGQTASGVVPPNGNGSTAARPGGPANGGPAAAPAATPPAATAARLFGNGGGLPAPNLPGVTPPPGGFPPPTVKIYRSPAEVNGVTYDLFLMDGSVVPQMPPAVAADLIRAEQIVIDEWPYIDGPSGRSHGGVAIDWSFAAGTVANVRTTPHGGAALDGWRVHVVTDIGPGPSTPTETRLKVTITTTFERNGQAPQSGLTEVILTGAGRHEISYRELPALAPAAG